MTPADSTDDADLIRVVTKACLAVALLLTAVSLIVRSLLPARVLPAVVQWIDVTLVQIAAVLPLAWWVGVWSLRFELPRRIRSAVVALAAGLLLVLVAAVFTEGEWLAQSVLGSLGALLVMASSVVLALQVHPIGSSAPVSLFTLISLLSVVVIVPATYFHARMRNETRQLAELLDQSRYGEALVIARVVEAADVSTRINGRPIRDVVRTLDRGVATLVSQTEMPLPDVVTDQQLIARARNLAMLGRTDEALIVLDACRDSAVECLLLKGTIHETRANWSEGLESYQAVRTELARQPADRQLLPFAVQAVRGVAYCARKAGQVEVAAKACRDLVKMSPTADSYFLAAQFYEDAQLTSQAFQHATQAMALDPQQFGLPARQLIDRLQTAHFGCWGVYRSRGASR